MLLIVWILIAYFLGSIPFSYIIPKINGIDVRKIGSGNVGGTNVLRSLGAKIGILCMVLDLLKAFLPVVISYSLYGKESWIPYLVGIFAVVGHDYPVWLKFKGGKGVASTVGTYFGFNYVAALVFYFVWFPIILITKYISLGSLMGLLVCALMSFITNYRAGVVGLILFFMSLYKHRENIKRLFSGTENKTDIVEIIKKGFNR
ncbi:MAG: glycerol-3-phosphate 1-O-acyltransferase PlsY [Thermotogae bacterium]|nr:glycerol-3-phosphate 1-O-acyltransferase PlsY [Thermotogota bacterium]MCP5465634.1 glycerol-3-phosphate 1-O-acyltransferase PlsY [Thermotogota bacterium]HOO73838.1 glycerol-3-phosphate 1-O-acyltransferase PlsY [Tepiditoga sp.]